MCTNRANFRRLLSYMDMSAVAADPYDLSFFAENLIFLYIFQKIQVSGLMLFFNGANHFKQLGDMVKALLLRFFCKGGIHVSPLIILTGRRVFQILRSCTDSVMQQLKPHFRMLFFIVCRFLEQSGDLLISLFFCFRSIECVFVSRLRFSGKGSLQIGFRLGTLQIHSLSPLLIKNDY